jgi:hypothetical protein
MRQVVLGLVPPVNKALGMMACLDGKAYGLYVVCVLRNMCER